MHCSSVAEGKEKGNNWETTEGRKPDRLTDGDIGSFRKKKKGRRGGIGRPKRQWWLLKTSPPHIAGFGERGPNSLSPRSLQSSARVYIRCFLLLFPTQGVIEQASPPPLTDLSNTAEMGEKGRRRKRGAPPRPKLHWEASIIFTEKKQFASLHSRSLKS